MYELMLVSVLDGLKLPAGIDEWRRGTPVEVPSAPLTVKVPKRDKPLPKCFRSLTPVVADDVIAFLRERGADNLQTVAANVKIAGQKQSVPGYSVVNVSTTLSLASFFTSLPAPQTFGSRQGGVDNALNDVSSLMDKLLATAATQPKPTAVIARLAEWNHPLLVRSDIARELEARGTTGARFDDVRFCSLYLGTGFYSLVSDAIKD
jgi:hypothetical protein